MPSTSFVVAFFASKRVSLITAFLCWTPEEISRLSSEARAAAMRVRVVNDLTRLPSLLPYDTHREGMLLDATCSDAQLVLQEASSSRAFNHRHSWFFLHESSYNYSVLQQTLSDAVILPDADVTWSDVNSLLDVYRIKAYEPLICTKWALNRTESANELEAFWVRQPSIVTRRKDLRNVYLKAEVIVSQPQYFKGWSDLRDRQIDTYPKLTYPIMMLVAEDLHFRYNLRQVDAYGEERNGSFDGLVGRLQRYEIELGIASVFMRADRWRVLHYCAETLELRGAFLFRQPSQSAVKNVFVLPFSRGVWSACVGVTLLGGLVLAVLSHACARVDRSLGLITPADTFTFAIGAVCQQGFHVTPALMSARLVMFSSMLMALFSFTAYSAKVVSILQAPSDAIRTIDDITHSRMDIGVQETTYKKVYFAESTDAATQRLYRKKLLPLGDAAYLSVVEGIERVRTGFFAFQVEESSGYDVISRTYTEHEKCGLSQIQAFTLPMVAVPIRKHSGYRELLAARLRWQREVGLMSQTRRMWMSARPRCDLAGGGGFLSIGLVNVLPALQILAFGAALATAVLLAEHAVYLFRLKKLSHRCRRRGRRTSVSPHKI